VSKATPLAFQFLALSACCYSGSVGALAFRTDVFGEPLGALVDLELAYGARWRVQDRDPNLIGPGNGGSRPNGNSNFDDGDLNYDVGKPVSSMFKAYGELTLKWGNFGAYASAYAFYDLQNERRQRARTELSSEALEQVGSGIELLDAYIATGFEPGGMPLQFRLGQQVVSWGESRFFPADSINLANPLNLPLTQQPTGLPRDLRLPVGMLWGSLQLNPTLAIEGYYQYEWQATVLPAQGTYLSTNDVITPGAQSVQVGPFPDQGTDVDAAFGLPPGTVGFVPNWFQTPRASDDSPSDQGQFGLSLRLLVPNWNDTSFNLQFVNYHSKTPSVQAITPGTENYLEYSLQAIAAQSAQLQQAGADPASATQAAGTIQFNQFLNAARYRATYAENIRMVGFSFSTTSLKTGTAFFGEIGYHFDAPIPVVLGQISYLAFPGASPADPLPPIDLEQTSPAEITAIYANKTIDLYEKRDKTFVALGATQIFGPQLGASQSTLTAELGWLHVWNFPSKDELLIGVPGIAAIQSSPDSVFADANSWGYRVTGNLTYNNVFGAVTMVPRFIFAQDVNGNSPSGAGSLREGNKSFSVGLQARHVQTLQTELSYTTFFGAGAYNLRNDRDFVNFNIRYFF
jgi:hypothetical protein